jgi:PTH1 family peptidyl-tRNA hydrolase
MALFQKKPQVSTSAPLYTLGLNKTVLIVGLGNIGKQYNGTRHNIGFACVDAFAHGQQLGSWTLKKDLKAQVASGNAGDTRILVIKPTTFMNNSGEAVQAAIHFYKIPLEQVIVVHDELDIPFGQIRTRMGGSDAGNNGIKSIILHCGEQFGRVRIGIQAETPMSGKDFVLAPFDKTEAAQLPNLIRDTTAILTEYLYGGQLPHHTRSFLV